MTDETQETWGDPLSVPFWQAARRHELVVQRCGDCGHHQFYARPFCLECQGDGLDWVTVAGTGTVYTRSTIHPRTREGPGEPYTVAVVELDEGPRFTTNLVNGDPQIGERVRVAWRDREEGPPVPVFEPAG